MDQEIKALWTAALREEGRKQAAGRLEFQSGAQCCLGVLCEVLVKNNLLNVKRVVQEYPYYDPEVTYVYVNEKGEEAFGTHTLPLGLAERVGLGDDTGLIPNGKTYEYTQKAYDENDEEVDEISEATCLAELNDSGQYDFRRIADIIDQDF